MQPMLINGKKFYKYGELFRPRVCKVWHQMVQTGIIQAVQFSSRAYIRGVCCFFH